MPERFSASVAARHMTCPASADLAKAIPNYIAPVEDRSKDTAANRGTAKHEMLEPIMSLPASDILGMAKYLEYVGTLRKKRRFKVLVEESMAASWLVSEPKTTADLVLYTQDELHIVDGKWGKIPVLVDHNTQLLFYAVTYAALAPKAKGVTLHILQPAVDGFESWYATADILREFMEKAQEAERKIMQGDTTFSPGDHCQFCPANPHSRGLKGHPYCPAMLEMLYPGRVDEDAILSI